MTAVRAIPRTSPISASQGLTHLGDDRRRHAGLTDELTAGAADRFDERDRPQVLDSEHGDGAVGLELAADLLDVFLVEQPAFDHAVDVDELRIEVLAEPAELDRPDGAVGVLEDEQQVDDADDPLLDDVAYRWRDLPVELVAREPYEDDVDGSGCGHGECSSRLANTPRTGLMVAARRVAPPHPQAGG